VVEVLADAVGACKVPAGAARDQRQLDSVAARDPLDDLVDGPVTADDDEQRRALVRRLTGQVPELTRRVGEDRLAAKPGGVSGPGDVRPPFSRLPVRRCGVDEEDGLLGQRYFSAVIVRRARSVI
jgi:hypothetical protein